MLLSGTPSVRSVRGDRLEQQWESKEPGFAYFYGVVQVLFPPLTPSLVDFRTSLLLLLVLFPGAI